MPPQKCDRFRRAPSRRDTRGAVFAALLAALLPGSAVAVVGGAESSGPLAAATVMVLNSRGGVCSGIVLAPDVVLTAAHCVAGREEVRVHFKGPDGAPVLIAPKAVAMHPGYDSGAVAGRRRSIDLALLRVPEPLPARFGAVALASGRPGKGEAVIVGGYGVSREGDARSTGTFRTAELASVEPYGPSTILLWAAGQAGRGACEGDSGGPVAGPGGSVVAVTIWAAGTGRRGCGAMSQGMFVAAQRGWIDLTLSGWGRAADWR